MLIRDTNIKVDRDCCIACGICVDRCVMDNLRLSVAPCRQSCPLQINCQGVMKLIAKGKEQQAVSLLIDFLPFMGLLGLFCHAPCEKACAQGKVDKSVNIRAIHSYLAGSDSRDMDTALQQINTELTGKKVAIWGSGPAAMMAAWCLVRSGHQVFMFESEKEPGGVMGDYASISDDSAQAVRTLIDAVTTSGTEIKAGVAVSEFKELVDNYDAVILTYKNDEELQRILSQNDMDKAFLQTDPRTFQVAGQEKLFACNDLSDSRSRLAAALAKGKTASESAHRFVSGVPLMWERGFWEAKGNVKAYAAPYAMAKRVQQEDKTFQQCEDDTDLKFDSKEAAIFEAERCLGCGRPFDANQTCWYCLPCEIECPTHAIEVRIPYLLR